MYQLWDMFSAMLCLSEKKRQEGIRMKGFTTSAGYMGWVEDRYILFASEYDYREYMED